MNLGCQCEYLKYDEFDNQKTVDGKFKRADILYLGGGNTLFYMKQIKKYNLAPIIEQGNTHQIREYGSSGFKPRSLHNCIARTNATKKPVPTKTPYQLISKPTTVNIISNAKTPSAQATVIQNCLASNLKPKNLTYCLLYSSSFFPIKSLFITKLSYLS